MVHDPRACRRRNACRCGGSRVAEWIKESVGRARFFAALSPPRRHRVRILAKRLRYALDLFSVALPKQATSHYVKALAQLQDVLGKLNDATVASSVLPELSKSPRLRASAEEWFRSVERECVPEAERRLLALSTMQKPWK